MNNSCFFFFLLDLFDYNREYKIINYYLKIFNYFKVVSDDFFHNYLQLGSIINQIYLIFLLF